MPQHDFLADSHDLVPAVERCMRGSLAPGTVISHLDRRVSPYSSSYAMEEIDVHLTDASVLPLVFKNLSPDAILEDARLAKPALLYDPLREIEIYRDVLDSVDVGAPRLYGWVGEQSIDRYWLFLERVDGSPLSQVGDLDTWVQAARWLGRMHGRLRTERLRWPRRTIRYDAPFYRQWLARAIQAARPETACELTRLAATYEQVISRLVSMEHTLIHGELYASNLLIADTPSGLRVCPLDWEMAAQAPALMDVAALTAGRWTEDERTRLALEYRDAAHRAGERVAAGAQLLQDLACCRLHLALLWLGWLTTWQPPSEHSHDWLGEALYTARVLGLI